MHLWIITSNSPTFSILARVNNSRSKSMCFPPPSNAELLNCIMFSFYHKCIHKSIKHCLIFPCLIPFNHLSACPFHLFCTNWSRLAITDAWFWKEICFRYFSLPRKTVSYPLQTSVYKGYKQDKIEMRGDRAEMSDFPLYLNTVAGGLDRRDQTIGGFSFVVKIYALPVVEIIGQLLYLLGRYGFNAQFGDCLWNGLASGVQFFNFFVSVGKQGRIGSGQRISSFSISASTCASSTW